MTGGGQPFASGNHRRPYSCPGCGGPLRHRLVDGQAVVGKHECCDCREWVDDAPGGGYALVHRVLPALPELEEQA